MNWSRQGEVIEVPLMGCTATVNVRAMDSIEEQVSDAFFKWLNPMVVTK